MSEPLPPFFQKDFSAGMITNVNENVIPRNAVALGMNVDFDNELGSAVVRPGTDAVATNITYGEPILGLHDFQDSTGDDSQLLVATNDGAGNGAVYTSDNGF